MTNCKVGDLAIIVKDNGFQENLGITVQIVAHAGYMNWYGFSLRLKRSYKRPRRLYSWRVVALSNQGICYENKKGELYFSREGDLPDYCLQRLPKIQFTNEEFIDEGNVMKQKKQSLVELAESLGFTRAADDDPIYTEGIVIVSTVGAELERLEQEESSQKPPIDKP